MNQFMSGFYGLLEKEILRFWRVVFQTIAAPVLSALLWMAVLAHAVGERASPGCGVSFIEFLIPGLVMMSVLQNSFSNSSSSLIQSKVTGNLLLMILPPISASAFFYAYAGASVIRGAMVGLGVLAAGVLFEPNALPVSPLIVLVFAILGGLASGALGIIAGLWAEKFDQIGMFTNFIILPLTFLSGVFYSIDSLPPFWQTLSHFNPFFYMIDGFRRGFFDCGDVSLSVSLSSTIVMTAAVSWFAWYLIRQGYKIKS